MTAASPASYLRNFDIRFLSTIIFFRILYRTF